MNFYCLEGMSDIRADDTGLWIKVNHDQIIKL